MRYLIILLTLGFLMGCAAHSDTIMTEKEMRDSCIANCSLDKDETCEVIFFKKEQEQNRCLKNPYWCERHCSSILYN